jgi:hypothetical protein
MNVHDADLVTPRGSLAVTAGSDLDAIFAVDIRYAGNGLGAVDSVRAVHFIQAAAGGIVKAYDEIDCPLVYEDVRVLAGAKLQFIVVGFIRAELLLHRLSGKQGCSLWICKEETERTDTQQGTHDNVDRPETSITYG